MSKTKLVPVTTWGAVVGMALMSLRVKVDHDQNTIAGACGVTQSTWSRIEHGESALTVNQLNFAAMALAVEPESIIGRASKIRIALRARGVDVVPDTTFVLSTHIAIAHDALEDLARQGLGAEW